MSDSKIIPCEKKSVVTKIEQWEVYFLRIMNQVSVVTER